MPVISNILHEASVLLIELSGLNLGARSQMVQSTWTRRTKCALCLLKEKLQLSRQGSGVLGDAWDL